MMISQQERKELERRGCEPWMAFRPVPGAPVLALHSLSHPGMEPYLDFGLIARTFAVPSATMASDEAFHRLMLQFPGVFTPYGENAGNLGAFVNDLTSKAAAAILAEYQPGKLLCDICYEASFDGVAECDDGCPRPLDHEGLCRDTAADGEPCCWCGGEDQRLHRVSWIDTARLPTVGEHNEGVWRLNWGHDYVGPFPSAEAAWEYWRGHGPDI